MLRTVPFDEIKINKQKHNDSSFEKYSSRLQKNNTEFKIPDNLNKTKMTLMPLDYHNSIKAICAFGLRKKKKNICSQ